MRSGCSTLLVLLTLAGCAPEPATPVVHIGGSPPGPLPPAPARVAAPEQRSAAPEPPGDPELRPPDPPVAVAPPPTPPPNAAPPAVDAVRDLRRGSRSPRSTSLLITECQGLEALLSTTPASSPDRPKLLRRLGETYSELAAAAQLAGRTNLLTMARATAIKHYDTFATTYPQPCPGPPTGVPCADEALYYLGIEHERAGDFARARKAYFTLISQHPQSRHIPGAYLAFGEMFLDEGYKDPSKLPLAETSFQEALKYPPPDNRVFGFAHLELGRARARRGERAGAAAAFKAALAWTRTYGMVPGASEIAAATQQELGALGVP